MDKADITAELVASLVAAQFPQWADLAVRPVDIDGWDNATFRLGDDLVVRCPSGAGYAPQGDREHRWLPVLAPQLPLPIPVELARGGPGPGYPWSWSVRRWIPGHRLEPDLVDDSSQCAVDLAEFLVTLAGADPIGGPPPEESNGWRGASLWVYDDGPFGTRESLAALATRIDTRAAADVWDAALEASVKLPSRWLHGDVTASNLLVAQGKLAAVIDFGCMAVGDPACDLTIAWTYFDPADAEVFRAHVAYDDATWARARGWALWKALITIAAAPDNPRDAGRAFGWRRDPYQVIDAVVADHRAAST